jgi:hypothetical protein
MELPVSEPDIERFGHGRCFLHDRKNPKSTHSGEKH